MIKSNILVNKNNQAFILVSLASPVFTKIYFQKVIDYCKNYNISLSIILLDELEVVNQMALKKITKRNAIIEVEKLKNNIMKNIGLEENGIEIIDFYTKYKSQVQDYYELLLKIYRTNKSFENNCKNQVYKNLHPLLRESGISRRDRNILDTLTNYLLYEIALKIYLSNSNNYNYEIAPKKEMEIMENIYQNKYPEITSIMLKKINFVTL